MLAVTANSMSIRWEEPYHDGGSKVTGYWIEKKERNTILWVRENTIPCFECYYKVDGLIEGLEYQFRVYAMNSAGLSKASEASKRAVAQNPVGKLNKINPRTVFVQTYIQIIFILIFYSYTLFILYTFLYFIF